MALACPMRPWPSSCHGGHVLGCLNDYNAQRPIMLVFRGTKANGGPRPLTPSYPPPPLSSLLLLPDKKIRPMQCTLKCNKIKEERKTRRKKKGALAPNGSWNVHASDCDVGGWGEERKETKRKETTRKRKKKEERGKRKEERRKKKVTSSEDGLLWSRQWGELI